MSILRPKFSTSGYFKKKRKPSKKKDSINLNESNDSEIIDQTPKARRAKGKKGFRGTKIFNFIKIAKDLRKKKKAVDAPVQIEKLEAATGATGDDFIKDTSGGVELRPIKEIKTPKPAKFCTECGSKFLQDSHKFCGDCGSKR